MGDSRFEDERISDSPSKTSESSTSSERTVEESEEEELSKFEELPSDDISALTSDYAATSAVNFLPRKSPTVLRSKKVPIEAFVGAKQISKKPKETQNIFKLISQRLSSPPTTKVESKSRDLTICSNPSEPRGYLLRSERHKNLFNVPPQRDSTNFADDYEWIVKSRKFFSKIVSSFKVDAIAQQSTNEDVRFTEMNYFVMIPPMLKEFMLDMQVEILQSKLDLLAAEIEAMCVAITVRKHQHYISYIKLECEKDKDGELFGVDDELLEIEAAEIELDKDELLEMMLERWKLGEEIRRLRESSLFKHKGASFAKQMAEFGRIEFENLCLRWLLEDVEHRVLFEFKNQLRTGVSSYRHEACFIENGKVIPFKDLLSKSERKIFNSLNRVFKKQNIVKNQSLLKTYLNLHPTFMFFLLLLRFTWIEDRRTLGYAVLFTRLLQEVYEKTIFKPTEGHKREHFIRLVEAAIAKLMNFLFSTKDISMGYFSQSIQIFYLSNFYGYLERCE